MAQVYVKYNPYRLETTLKVNGRDISTDSILYKVTKGKRLQEWITLAKQAGLGTEDIREMLEGLL